MSNSFYRPVITLALLFLSACTAVGSNIITEGGSFIKRSGLAVNVKEGLFKAVPEEPKRIFTPQDKQVTWWGEHNAFFFSEQKFTGRWYTPDGTLFKQTEGRTFRTNYIFARVSMPIDSQLSKDQLGRWRLEVYWNDTQVDAKNFYIVPPEETARLLEEESQLSSKVVNRESKERKSIFEDSGLAVEASNTVLSGQGDPTHLRLSGSTFRPTDRQVVWWGKLPAWSFASWSAIRIRWYDADGKLVFEQRADKGGFLQHSKFATSTLQLIGKPWANRFGQWKVKILKGEKVVETYSFKLEEGKASLASKGFSKPLPEKAHYEEPSSRSDSDAISPTHAPLRHVILLVFPSSLDLSTPTARALWEPERFLDQQIPLSLEFPDDRISWPDRYGYVLVYDKQAGGYGVQFRWVDQEKGRAPVQMITEMENGMWKRSFPNDLSEQLSSGYKAILLERGYNVMDLTPYRHKLEGYSGEEILELTAEKYGASAVFFVGYSAFSAKFSQHVSAELDYKINTVGRSLGLSMVYRVAMFETKSKDRIFDFENEISAFSRNIPTAFESLVYLDERGFPLSGSGSGILKSSKAIMQDDWLVERVLGKIRGKRFGGDNGVRVGGQLALVLPYAGDRRVEEEVELPR